MSFHLYHKRSVTLREFLRTAGAIYVIFCVVFSTILFSIILVDQISPKDLTSCLDTRAQSLTISSK